ncbi:MAG: hypothetical protein O7D91_15005 [Planctomycetota bacterium]|nr:hypothetical protein [Planctomycetota bacterium]
MGGMHVVEALSDARAFDTSDRESFALTAGLQYVVHDPEAACGVRDGAFKAICKLDEMLPRYDGQPLTNERVLVAHIGGMGDGLVLAACLKALKDRYPDCTIDVPCPALHHPLLKLVDADVNIMPYPPPAAELKHYSYYMSLEDVDRHATDPAMSNIQIFGSCLRTPEATEAVKLKLPSALLEQWDIGKARQPRVGIALTKSVHMKAYPVDLALKLVQALLKKDLAVLLFGASNEIGRDLPHAPPMLFNLVDKTPDIASLAAIFSQLDAVVCPDTMFMHLAGALRLPTLTIFTCTHVSAAGGYPTVRLATADVPCRPCGAVAHTCPIGHSACIVPRHADLAPKRLAEAVMDLLRTRPTADQSPLAKMGDSR